MKKRIEFPLYELLMILILLGVLALFALPKVIDVGTEARIKTLNNMVLNLSAVNSLLYSRASIKNVANLAWQPSDILGEESAGGHLVYGELSAQQKDLQIFVDLSLLTVVQGKESLRLYLPHYKNESCFVEYRQASTTNHQANIKKASYHVSSTGC